MATYATELISRVRDQGADGIAAADLEIFKFRPGFGRLVRADLVDALLPDFRKSDLPLLRALIQEETLARNCNGGCGKILFGLALMLYSLGELEDVLALHAAKFANMDAGGMIDLYMLRMGRSEAEVLTFVRNRLVQQPDASQYPIERVLQDVKEAFEFDDFDSAEQCVQNAFSLMDSTYGNDLDFEED